MKFPIGITVAWTYVDSKGETVRIVGTVTGEGAFGRIIVQERNGTVHHIQPDFVETEL